MKDNKLGATLSAIHTIGPTLARPTDRVWRSRSVGILTDGPNTHGRTKLADRKLWPLGFSPGDTQRIGAKSAKKNYTNAQSSGLEDLHNGKLRILRVPFYLPFYIVLVAFRSNAT